MIDISFLYFNLLALMPSLTGLPNVTKSVLIWRCGWRTGMCCFTTWGEELPCASVAQWSRIRRHGYPRVSFQYRHLNPLDWRRSEHRSVLTITERESQGLTSSGRPSRTMWKTDLLHHPSTLPGQARFQPITPDPATPPMPRPPPPRIPRASSLSPAVCWVCLQRHRVTCRSALFLQTNSFYRDPEDQPPIVGASGTLTIGDLVVTLVRFVAVRLFTPRRSASVTLLPL